MKGSKPKMVLIALVGAVAFVIARRAVGSGIEAPEASDEDRGIDTVRTRDEADEEAEADEGVGIDIDDEVEADEAADAGAADDDTDLEVRAVEKALDAFDYLAIGAAGAKAAYEEYRRRAS